MSLGRQSERENSTGNGEEEEPGSGEKKGGWTPKSGGKGAADMPVPR